MTDYKYTVTQEGLRRFLTKIKTAGKPERASHNWLKDLGFTSGNHSAFIGILKFIGFADSSGIPTNKWDRFRSPNEEKIVMGEALKDTYSELFKIYHDANVRGNEDLKSFFSQHTNAGSEVQKHMIRTFKTLCGFADFEQAEPEDSTQEVPKSAHATPTGVQGITPSSLLTGINIKIELSLPETENVEVYQNFFKAMYEYLIKPYRSNE